MNIYKDYLTENERELEMLLEYADLEFSKIDTMLYVIESKLEQMYQEAEIKVLTENGTFDDLVVLYEEANETTNNSKVSIWQQFCNILSNIWNKFLGLFNKNKKLSNEMDQDEDVTVNKEEYEHLSFIKKIGNDFKNALDGAKNGNFSAAISLVGKLAATVGTIGVVTKSTTTIVKKRSEIQSAISDAQGVVGKVKAAFDAIFGKSSNENSEDNNTDKNKNNSNNNTGEKDSFFNKGKNFIQQFITKAGEFIQKSWDWIVTGVKNTVDKVTKNDDNESMQKKVDELRSEIKDCQDKLKTEKNVNERNKLNKTIEKNKKEINRLLNNKQKNFVKDGSNNKNVTTLSGEERKAKEQEIKNRKSSLFETDKNGNVIRETRKDKDGNDETQTLIYTKQDFENKYKQKDGDKIEHFKDKNGVEKVRVTRLLTFAKRQQKPGNEGHTELLRGQGAKDIKSDEAGYTKKEVTYPNGNKITFRKNESTGEVEKYVPEKGKWFKANKTEVAKVGFKDNYEYKSVGNKQMGKLFGKGNTEYRKNLDDGSIYAYKNNTWVPAEKKEIKKLKELGIFESCYIIDTTDKEFLESFEPVDLFDPTFDNVVFGESVNMTEEEYEYMESYNNTFGFDLSQDILYESFTDEDKEAIEIFNSLVKDL